jgi:hypothetical protein
MKHVFEVKDGGEVYWWVAESHEKADRLHRAYKLMVYGAAADFDGLETPVVLPGNRTLSINGVTLTCEKWAMLKDMPALMVGTTAV